jgi:hypothetical protein
MDSTFFARWRRGTASCPGTPSRAVRNARGDRRIRPFLALAAALVAVPAHAIRPFVTDDARVVGERLAQLETWLFAKREYWTHNALFAVGPTDWLELTTGFAQGATRNAPDREYSITGGILQGKALLREARPDAWPGVAVAAGILPPTGEGFLRPKGVGGFVYGMLTKSMRDDDLLIHANLGITGERGHDTPPRSVTSGVGFQARVLGGFHAVGEIYRGDPYDPLFRSSATQFGFRHIFSDEVQIDGTVGTTLSGESETWITLGIRLVTKPLW